MSEQGVGYWTAGIDPLPERSDRFAPGSLLAIVDANAVALRGWNYPHIPRNDPQGVLTLPGGGIAATVNWDRYHELWRFFPSGLFVHRWQLREDDTSYRGTLHFVAAIYTLVEVFEFARRLYGQEESVEQVAIRISLTGVLNRAGSGDDLSDLPYHLRAKSDAFLHEVIVSRVDLAVDSAGPSVLAAEALFGQLGFAGISLNFIEDRVKRFLGGLR
jgi:hypothetical protein